MEVYPNFLLGWRGWTLEEKGLRSLRASDSHHWVPGINTAECKAHFGHDTPPTPECECGLHAYHQLHRGFWVRAIQGLVACRGKVHIHSDGFRAEQATIIGLLDNPALPLEQYDLLLETADRYCVPVVGTTRDLERLGERAGGVWIPKDLKPNDPTNTSFYGLSPDRNKELVRAWNKWDSGIEPTVDQDLGKPRRSKGSA